LSDYKDGAWERLSAHRRARLASVLEFVQTGKKFTNDEADRLAAEHDCHRATIRRDQALAEQMLREVDPLTDPEFVKRVRLTAIARFDDAYLYSMELGRPGDAVKAEEAKLRVIGVGQEQSSDVHIHLAPPPEDC